MIRAIMLHTILWVKEVSKVACLGFGFLPTWLEKFHFFLKKDMTHFSNYFCSNCIVQCFGVINVSEVMRHIILDVDYVMSVQKNCLKICMSNATQLGKKCGLRKNRAISQNTYIQGVLSLREFCVLGSSRKVNIA